MRKYREYRKAKFILRLIDITTAFYCQKRDVPPFIFVESSLFVGFVVKNAEDSLFRNSACVIYLSDTEMGTPK